MSEQPKSLIIIRPDTFGDLVIFGPFLKQVAATWPDCRITLLVREGYAELSTLLPTKIQWKTTALNPFRVAPARARSELESLVQELRQDPPEVILAPTLKRTWLEVAIASHFPAAQKLALGRAAVEPIFANELKLQFEIKADQVFREAVEVPAGTTDWEANERLCGALLGQAVKLDLPTVTVPDEARSHAAHVLRQLGLAEGERWFAVFPAGIANVPIKAWSPAHFGTCVRTLETASGMRAVLLAHENERTVINDVLAHTGHPVPCWLGRTGELAILAALLQRSSAYLGNDTGAMHLAGAVGTPLVGIFGGGHWPRFRPAARQAISVVQPLPCFGCDWDCIFGDAPCVKTIAPSDVEHAFGALLAAVGNGTALNEVHVARGIPTEAHGLITRAVPIFRQLQTDRTDRQHKIEELTYLGREKDVEIASLKGDADTKDAEINSLKAETNRKDQEISSLKAEADTKDAEIASLKAESDGKDGEIDSLKAETDSKDAEIASLKSEADTKDAEIASLKREADTKDLEIAQLKDTCNIREKLILEQDGHIRFFQKTIGELNTAHGRKDGVISDLRAANVSLEKRNAALTSENQEIKAQSDALGAKLSVLPSNALDYAELIVAKDVHIRNIEAMLAHRDAEIVRHKAEITQREQAIEHYRQGLGNLEQAKYFDRLLHEKELVIQTLHRACVERQTVINQLAVDNASLTKLQKTVVGAKAWWQLRVVEPFKVWSFKKLVEDYWMQIGILRQYDPRPIVWDRFPRSKRPTSALPQIGIVTPSYGQQAYIESTILSVLNQQYPKLVYAVQDGGSKDRSPQIIQRYADRLAHWESARDKGQADAIIKGFAKISHRLQPDDVMAWLNSDDFIAPRALHYVADFFARNPAVDVIYGHRIIIDGDDREVGRWIMPRHDPATLEWIDYVPQETLFWRKRIWDKVGGLDPSYQFALDWDLLARFQTAGANIVRVPYCLGCFRVHNEQKTTQLIHSTGFEEMTKIRTRFHGADHANHLKIEYFSRKARLTGAIAARLLEKGVRY